MKNDKIYTVTQAVIDAIESFPWDTPWHCYDLFNKSWNNLKLHGNPAKPYDGTIQRIMRKFRHVYCIVCIDRDKSVYIKKTPEIFS